MRKLEDYEAVMLLVSFIAVLGFLGSLSGCVIDNYFKLEAAKQQIERRGVGFDTKYVPIERDAD